MAMRVGERRGGVMAEINVTPMADVMIVLLIIFMVATPIIMSAPVPLPYAAQAVPRQGDDLKIVVKAHGQISVGPATFGDASALGTFVREQIAAAGDRRSVVLIQADREVSYSDVARVIEACRTAGAEEIGLAAQRKIGGWRARIVSACRTGERRLRWNYARRPRHSLRSTSRR